MKRRLFISLMVSMAALLLVTPVLAITFGELDGEQHPNVGALLVAWPYPDGPVDIVCTGTLIAPTIFLTAAHCVNWMPGAGIPAAGSAPRSERRRCPAPPGRGACRRPAS